MYLVPERIQKFQVSFKTHGITSCCLFEKSQQLEGQDAPSPTTIKVEVSARSKTCGNLNFNEFLPTSSISYLEALAAESLASILNEPHPTTAWAPVHRSRGQCPHQAFRFWTVGVAGERFRASPTPRRSTLVPRPLFCAATCLSAPATLLS